MDRMELIKTFANAHLDVEIRTVVEKGVVKFFLTDVARSLGYRDAANAKRVLRDSQSHTLSTSMARDLGFYGKLPIVVTEGGVYRLALRSNKPEAIPFQEWVEDEVLPAIRKDGGYVRQELTPQQHSRLTEKINYGVLRGMLKDASDYTSEDEDTRERYRRMQNLMYARVTGLDAKALREVREINRELLTSFRKDGEPYAKDRQIAKNYLKEQEIHDISDVVECVMVLLRMRTRKLGTYTMDDMLTELSWVLDNIEPRKMNHAVD